MATAHLSKPTTLAVAAALLTTVISVALFTRRWHDARDSGNALTLLFRLPDGFSGVAKVHFGCEDGMELTRIDNGYRFSIPSTGVLHVRNHNPELQWHRIEVSYQNGRALPVGYISRGDRFPDETVAAWPGAAAGEDIRIFVGTTPQYIDEIHHEQRRLGLPLRP